MNDRLKKFYDEHRAKGVGAASAMAYARARIKYEDNPGRLKWTRDKRGVLTARWREDSFDIVSTMEVDECPDSSYLGEFSRDPKPGALDHHRLARLGSYERGRTLRWFNPAYSETERYKDLRSCELSRTESREQAHQYLMLDYERASALGETWYMTAMHVVVSKNGIKLDERWLGGLEDDTGQDYLEECARDLAADGVAEARKCLEDLCECQ